MSRALIAGGGIAGMAAALALAREGWQVTVCERAAAPAEVGAGLQLSPNATKVLRMLGVFDAVAAQASRPTTAEMRDGLSGSQIYRLQLGAMSVARWGAPYFHVHRADLLTALTDAARAAGAEIRNGTQIEGYVIRPERPALKFPGGETLDGDLVIGADGIRSVLRGQLNGAEAPEFTGQIAWRGTIPAAHLPKGLVTPGVTVWAGSGRHLVTYPLRGGSLVNFVAVEQRSQWTEEGWSAPGDPEELRRAFKGWHSDVTGLLDHVEQTFLWGLFTRPEQVRWVDGPVVLVGDAAHPMLPFMAQGAAMALEDVAVLMCNLRASGDVSAALRGFEQTRWPRVTRVQQKSVANGRLFHRPPGPARRGHWGLISAVTRLAPGLAARQLDWLYGHDATEDR